LETGLRNVVDEEEKKSGEKQDVEMKQKDDF
jgi:hypothetical protein